MARFVLLRSLLAAVACLAATPAFAQSGVSLDFESGLAGWQASGTAFDQQPTAAASLTAGRLGLVPLGGDYWKPRVVPLGHQGDSLVVTPNSGRGTLTSVAISLTPADQFFSVLIGGTGDVARAYVELQLEQGSGAFQTAWRVSGDGVDRLSRKTFQLPPYAAPRRARIVIADLADDAHLNIDHLTFSAAVVPEVTSPVWGLADYHTHPMAQLGFGGLKGPQILWGQPGGCATDYEKNPKLIERDLPVCITRHGGGPSAEIFINTVEGRAKGTVWDFLFGRLLSHSRSGAPRFKDFPSFRSGAHHQMHVTQIYRAWQGGLRLMTAIAVHNVGVEFLASRPGQVPFEPTSERAVLDAQVAATRQLAALNKEWMEIAESPASARDIINRGKLAVILAVEMDQSGSLAGTTSIDEELDYLWRLGIRQVTPIHAVNNALGGASLFQPAYNSLNDFLHRPDMVVWEQDLPKEEYFFQVREGGCADGPYKDKWGECVQFKFDETQTRPALTKRWLPFFRKTAPFIVDWNVPRYRDFDGHMNPLGLTDKGRGYINGLMNRGMLVALEHMSQQSVDDVYEVLGRRLADAGAAMCAGIGKIEVPQACYERAYPLVVSHAHLRGLSLKRGSTTVDGFVPMEYEIGDIELGMLRRTGGFIGQFTAEDPVEREGWTPPVANDCAGSTKSFANAYSYALDQMKVGVGLATDFTFIFGTAPRFGKQACWVYHSADDPKQELAKQPAHYKFEAQRNAVRYVGDARSKDVRHYAANDPLAPYVMGGRPHDFNTMGLAHYGLLPDFLQDVRNIGLPDAEWTALFASAEHFIQTWEKAERLKANSSCVAC